MSHSSHHVGGSRVPFPLLESRAQVPIGWLCCHDREPLCTTRAHLSLGLHVRRSLLGALDPQGQRTHTFTHTETHHCLPWPVTRQREVEVMNHTQLMTLPPQSHTYLFCSHVTGHIPPPGGGEVLIYSVLRKRASYLMTASITATALL